MYAVEVNEGRYEKLFKAVYRLDEIVQDDALRGIIASVPACYDAVKEETGKDAFSAYAATSYGLKQLKNGFRIRERKGEIKDFLKAVPSMSAISRGNFASVDNIITPHMELLAAVKEKSVENIAETTEWLYRKTREKAESVSERACVNVNGVLISIGSYFDASFDEVGGQKEAKEELKGLCIALKNPQLYKKWGVKHAKGVLLHGPPGTGKTLLAKALASEAEAEFYHIKVSDITSKWYGESEQMMQQAFDKAAKDGKAILFFDELDALAPKRSESYEATRRVVSTMLENMDGLERKDNVVVVGATNSLEEVDYALRRPGRMDRIIEVRLPSEDERDEIFRIHAGKAEEMAGRALFNGTDYCVLAEITDGFSGADIGEITRRVLEAKARSEAKGEKPGLVTTEDVMKEIDMFT